MLLESGEGIRYEFRSRGQIRKDSYFKSLGVRIQVWDSIKKNYKSNKNILNLERFCESYM